jgi:XTP/dITP diphosphohydrolase
MTNDTSKVGASPTPPFVIATANPDKAREIVEIFAAYFDTPLVAAAVESLDGMTIGFACAAPDEIVRVIDSIRRPDHAPDVEETGATLEANARIKAVGVARALGVPTIADDTGLEVDALGGAPGVLSARYAGTSATYEQNCELLLTEMRERLRASRTARFVTVAVRHDPASGDEVVARGKIEGVIVDVPRGAGGFGYDPVFAPAGGYGRTFAEMSTSEKHALSHRGRAFRALADSSVAAGAAVPSSQEL